MVHNGTLALFHLLRTRTQPLPELVEGKGGFDRLRLRLLAFKTNKIHPFHFIQNREIFVSQSLFTSLYLA